MQKKKTTMLSTRLLEIKYDIKTLLNIRSFDNSVLVASNFPVVTVGLKFKASLFSEPCPDPGRPHLGNRIGGDFLHGKLVTFTCPRDYVMEGLRTITCSDGRWSNKKPSCKGEVFCLSGLVHGFLTTIKPIPTKYVS